MNEGERKNFVVEENVLSKFMHIFSWDFLFSVEVKLWNVWCEFMSAASKQQAFSTRSRLRAHARLLYRDGATISRKN